DVLAGPNAALRLRRASLAQDHHTLRQSHTASANLPSLSRTGPPPGDRIPRHQVRRIRLPSPRNFTALIGVDWNTWWAPPTSGRSSLPPLVASGPAFTARSRPWGLRSPANAPPITPTS